MRPFRFGLLFITTLGGLACVALADCGGDAFSGSDGADDGSRPDVTADGMVPQDGIADAGQDGASDAMVLSDGCPLGATSSMVRINIPANLSDASFYCIDSTEVSNGQYQAFLAAKMGNTSGQIPACSWNTVYTPDCCWPNQANNPVFHVDWCDAYTYCAHRGLRLCGGVAGGTAQFDMPRATEWYNACSKLGERDYPYGLAFDPAACNGPEGGAPAPPATFPACVGPYPLLFDLSGNVAEWEDGCSSKDQTAECPARGGFYDSDEFGLTCLSLARLPKMTRAPWVGFRCCRG